MVFESFYEHLNITTQQIKSGDNIEAEISIKETPIDSIDWVHTKINSNQSRINLVHCDLNRKSNHVTANNVKQIN